MRLIIFSILLTLAFASCENSSKKEKDVSAKTEKKDVESEPEDKNVRNDISIKSEGVTVKQAFLMFEDSKLVPQDNKVEIGQKVNMRLIIEGWKAEDGKVYLGASEKITTDEGQTVLDEEDLFVNYPEGISEKDAGTITLSAVITRVDKLFKYFVISFRVWDKKSSDNISGSYRLYLK